MRPTLITTAAASVALALAACGATTTTTVTRVQTVTVAGQPSHARTHRTAPKPAAPTTPAASAPSTETSGNGTKNLGTLNVRTASTIHWTCSGCSTFAMAGLAGGDTSDIAINSSASSGTSAVAPGSYANVQLIATGNWTVKIVPG